MILAFLLLSSGAGLTLGAQEGEASPGNEELSGKVLSVSIKMEMVRRETVLWNQETRKLTLPGQPVMIRLNSPRMRLHSEITPYRRQSPDILLVARGQVWIQESHSPGVRYFTTMRTLSVNLGEPVFFFPLGGAENPPDDKAQLRMLIIVEAYPQEDLLEE